MKIEIEMNGRFYVVYAEDINLRAEFSIDEVDIMTAFIQSLVKNVTAF